MLSLTIALENTSVFCNFLYLYFVAFDNSIIACSLLLTPNGKEPDKNSFHSSVPEGPKVLPSVE